MQERRRLRPPFFMVKGYDSGRLLPARSGLSLPDPDSCHSCGTVCSTPSCNMDRITRYGDASCFFCPVIFSLRVVPASKKSLAEHVIRHPDVMRQNCRPKTELVPSYSRFMQAAIYSSASHVSKAFQSFWAPSACQPSTTSYHSCSAAPRPWLSAFSWAAHIFKAGRSLLAFGSNFAVKRTASPPLTLAVRPSILPLYAGPHLFQRFAFLKRFSAGVLAVWRASPGACALFQAF